ncbi:hypothetical protein N9X13_03820 [Alphaproteobacteria bacterium]|nr:hypothetical protein [Alphaproteobacteria bacterium]
MSIWNNMDWVLPLRTPFLNSFFELVTLGGYPLFLILFLCFGRATVFPYGDIADGDRIAEQLAERYRPRCAP